MKKNLIFSVVLGTLFLHGDQNSQLELQKCLTRMFINDDPPLIVDWSTKAGCTCVWKMLLDSYGLLEEALNLSPWIHNYRKQVYQKKHVTTPDTFFDQKYCKVKFVRNPYTRAVSSYLFCCKKTSWKGSFEDFLVLNELPRSKLTGYLNL